MPDNIKQELSDVLVAYLAGIVDGEGTVQFQSDGIGRSRSFVIEVRMTDRGIIEMLHQAFGGSFISLKRANVNWQDQWRWRVKNRIARQTYKILEPHLRLKRCDDYDRMPRPLYNFER